MPCRCSGVKRAKCDCVVDAVYPVRRNGSNLVLVRGRGGGRQGPPKRGVFTTLVESMYGMCAEYNLRYCQFRGFIKPGNQLGNTLKDLLVLACFIIANSVVLLTIVSKILIHLYFDIKHTACWLRRSLDAKMSDGAHGLQSTGRHDFTPPSARVYE